MRPSGWCWRVRLRTAGGMKAIIVVAPNAWEARGRALLSLPAPDAEVLSCEPLHPFTVHPEQRRVARWRP